MPASNGGTDAGHGAKKYIHWKESQMELLSKYLQTHVEYATSPSLESCYYIKRDVFPDDEEVTPKRLFGKICNMRAAFRRSGYVQQEELLDQSKKKRRRRHSHMDSIYNEFDVRIESPEESNGPPAKARNSRTNIQTVNPRSVITNAPQSQSQQQQQQQQLPPLWTHLSPPAQITGTRVNSNGLRNGISSNFNSDLSYRVGTNRNLGLALDNVNSHEGMINLLRNNLLDQLNHWDEITNRMFREKSPQDLLIEYLHKKMEQDAELNRILIASTERMAKSQADAQIQSAKLLKKCAQTLRTMAAVPKPGENDAEDEDDDDEDDDDDDDDEDGLAVA